MTRKLALTVHAVNEGGDRHVFRAGTVPPAWAQEAITNPHAWGDAIEEGVDEHDPDSGEVTTTDPAGDGGVPPPRVGKGSGRDEWAAYAEHRGVAVTDQMSRDDIVVVVDGLEV